jgi:N-formylglutamate amidohydrolase
VVPGDVRAGIVLDDAALDAELAHMTDRHTHVVAALAADRAAVRPWRFVNELSRLVVDPERLPDDVEEMVEVGMGAVYTGTAHLGTLRAPDPARDADLRRRFFDPYAAALTELVDDRLAECGAALVVDVHSYAAQPLPYERHADGARPAVCLGVDDEHTPDWLVDLARAAFQSVGDVAVNEPFAGTYVPLKHYGTDRRVSSLMVEIRRDTYMDEPGGDLHPGAEKVVAALTRLLDTLPAAGDRG